MKQGLVLKPLEKLKYFSISSRISILLGIIILLTMGTFSAFSLLKQKDDAISYISNNTQQLSETVERILRVSMLKNRRDEVSIAINNIVDKEGILSVRILNHGGSIKFSSQQSEVNTHISQTNQLCTNCHYKKNNKLKYDLKKFDRYKIDQGNNYIYNCVPIYNARNCYNEVCHSVPVQPRYLQSEKQRITAENERTHPTSDFVHDSTQTVLGFVEIEVSIKKVNANLASTRNQLIAFTILFALIASTITYFSIRRLVGKPVKNLLEGTMRVAQGNFKHEITPGKAELGLLSESFNKMQKQLLTKQSQLIESEKLASVGKLADEVANEINNPLTGIIIYSESLLNDKNISANKEEIRVIRHEALKIRESIRDILSLTNYDKPDFKTINLEKIIQRSVSVVEKFSNFRNIKIITGISKTLPEVSADAGLLEQVFLNLLLLSSESISAGGIINISATYSENIVEINFTDTGKKIPENILHKIFETSDTSVIDNLEKTGISLTVCKDIIEMHKGELTVSSTGSGNSINIKLPAGKNEPEN